MSRRRFDRYRLLWMILFIGSCQSNQSVEKSENATEREISSSSIEQVDSILLEESTDLTIPKRYGSPILKEEDFPENWSSAGQIYDSKEDRWVDNTSFNKELDSLLKEAIKMCRNLESENIQLDEKWMYRYHLGRVSFFRKGDKQAIELSSFDTSFSAMDYEVYQRIGSDPSMQCYLIARFVDAPWLSETSPLGIDFVSYSASGDLLSVLNVYQDLEHAHIQSNRLFYMEDHQHIYVKSFDSEAGETWTDELEIWELDENGVINSSASKSRFSY